MVPPVKHVQENFYLTENRRIDALTNAAMPRIDAEIRSPADLARLRERWAKLDSIPKIVMGREDAVDHSWLGLDVRTLLLGDESSGRFSIHDIVLAPGAELPTYYLKEGHTYFWVVEGQVDLRIGAECRRTQRESYGYAPAMTRQGVSNPTAQPAQIVIAYSPAGSDRAFEAARAHWLETGDRDLSVYREILGRYGFCFDDAVLENDKRINEKAERLEADIQVIDDLFELRERWARQRGVPKLVLDIGNAKTLPGIPSVPLTDGDESSGHSICSLLSPQPGYRATLHHQPAEEELFYFLDGDYELTAGSTTVNVRRGTFVIAPRFATHGGMNHSNRPVRFIGMNAPAGHERAYDMLMRERHSERLPELFKAYGFFLLEPVNYEH
jgi:mannose-6-phosphate isomerase-like protein (cupin superfamily)